MGFGAKALDRINAKNEVTFNIKVKLTCDSDGTWSPTWVGLDEMDSKSITRAPTSIPAQKPKVTKQWQPVGPRPISNKMKSAQVQPIGSNTTNPDPKKPSSTSDLKKSTEKSPEISISNSFSIFQHGETSSLGENYMLDPMGARETSKDVTENTESSIRQDISETRVLPREEEEPKRAIVLCKSADDPVPPMNPLEVDRTWGSSFDWVLELQDGRRLSIPISLLRQPDVQALVIPGMSLSGFGVMGPAVEDQHSMGSYLTSDAEENSEDDIPLVWEDSEAVGEGSELVCWGDEVVPLEIEPLATSKPEIISMEARCVKEKEDSAQADIPSDWVLGRLKRIGKLLGASYEGYEERVTHLLMEIDARRTQRTSEGGMKLKKKVGGKGSRELKRLSCSINYQSDSATARSNSRERVLLLSQ